MARFDTRARRELGGLERIAPIYAVAIAIAAGDAIGNVRVGIPIFLLLVAAALSVSAFLAARRSVGLALAYAAIVGAASIPVSRLLDPPPSPASVCNLADGTEVTIEGSLVREIERMPDRMRVYVEVARAGLAGQGLERSSGIVRVTVLDRPTWRIGDRVALTSRIRFPRNDGNPGEFDYEAFMARNRIRATMTMQAGTFGTTAFQIIGYRRRFPATQIEAVRDRIGAFIDANLPWPERAEMRAIVIGDRGGIDDALRAKFARTGMAHLLVISGLHLSFVAAAIFALVRLAMMLAPGLASRGYANKAAAIAAGLAVCGYAAIAATTSRPRARS